MTEHTEHCLKRQKFGDGECDCSVGRSKRENNANDGQSRLTVGLGAEGIAFEYEACMRAMDVAGVPRTDQTFGAVYSIWGRAQWMAANKI